LLGCQKRETSDVVRPPLGVVEDSSEVAWLPEREDSALLIVNNTDMRNGLALSERPVSDIS